MTKDMEFHQLADVFPLIEGVEFAELVSSVLARGQLEKIITYEGKILDGRNRYLACRQAGVEPACEEFEGTFQEARDHVIDANLRRRHMTTSQRAMVAARLANLAVGSNQYVARVTQDIATGEKFSPPMKVATDALKIDRKTGQYGKRVLSEGAPELVAAVERGDISVSRAAKIASLPREEQAAKISEPKYDVASPPNLPPSREAAHPLRNLEYLAAGELARWIKITTPNDRLRVIRMLRECAGILEAEMERANG
jgi:hypothetical protein